MSRRRMYMQDTLECQKRFFEALHLLSESKSLPGGLAGYCETFCIDRRHLYAQKKDNGRGYFEIAWVTPLIRYYGISANWLLLGKGKISK
jgi:hypothetical protein